MIINTILYLQHLWWRKTKQPLLNNCHCLAFTWRFPMYRISGKTTNVLIISSSRFHGHPEMNLSACYKIGYYHGIKKIFTSFVAYFLSSYFPPLISEKCQLDNEPHLTLYFYQMTSKWFITRGHWQTVVWYLLYMVASILMTNILAIWRELVVGFCFLKSNPAIKKYCVTEHKSLSPHVWNRHFQI